MVAPYVGAWIEINSKSGQRKLIIVAPYVGAWIEILLLLAALVGKFLVAPYGK